MTDKVHISGTGNNVVLIENCHNVDIAPGGGTVAGPGNVRVAARPEFADNSGITLRNFTLANSALVENPCGSDGLKYSGVKVSNSPVTRCQQPAGPRTPVGAGADAPDARLHRPLSSG